MVNQKVAARLQVGPNCLLFFIDETGHETLADKNYPVFGLRGCAISSSSAAVVIAEPIGKVRIRREISVVWALQGLQCRRCSLCDWR